MLFFGVFAFGTMLNPVSASTSQSKEFNTNTDEEENISTNLGSEVKMEGRLSEPEHPPEFELECVSCGTPKYNIIKKSSPTKVKRFVRYLTGSWAKPDRYNWNKSQSGSSTLSANIGVSAGAVSANLGVSNTVTTTYGVTISIPANKKKWSKLAFYSDFNRRQITTKLNVYPHTVKSGYHYAPRKDTYLQVVYR